MMNQRNRGTTCGLCGGGRIGRRQDNSRSVQDPMWGAYGTRPAPVRQGQSPCVGNGRVTQHQGESCPWGQTEQRSQRMSNGCGCGCQNHAEGQSNGNGAHQADCQKLLQQIRTVDFALYEVILYLDVYPNDCEALHTYHQLVARHKTLCQQYEQTCGPITATGNESHTTWDWIKKPFPWENDAN